MSDEIISFTRMEWKFFKWHFKDDLIHRKDVDNLSKATIAALLGADVRRPDDVCQKLIEFAYASDSRFTIIPMQDVLKLDSKSRMNTPGTVGTNWGWRLKPDYKFESEAGRLKALCQKYLR